MRCAVCSGGITAFVVGHVHELGVVAGVSPDVGAAKCPLEHGTPHVAAATCGGYVWLFE